MSELKNCPFCGSNKIEEDWGATYNVTGGDSQNGDIECKECGACVMVDSFNDSENSESLRLKWNTRAKSEQIKKLTEALESMSNFNMKLIGDHNKRNPPWDYIDQEHLHDAFELLAEIKG